MALSLLICWLSSTSYAIDPTPSLPVDPNSYTQVTDLISSEAVLTLVKTVGMAGDHRPYEGATPLGLLGFDLGVEATMIKLPEGLQTILEQAGTSAANLPPAVPIPKGHFHKGFGPVDLGVSGIGFGGYLMAGGGIKLSVYNPYEGLTWALKLNYGYAKMGVVKTHTFTPQIVASRRLAFAEPYLGVGYQYMKGTIEISVPPSLLDSVPAEYREYVETAIAGREVGIKATAKSTSYIAFIGLGMHLAFFKLGLEGAFSQKKNHTLGAKFGFHM